MRMMRDKCQNKDLTIAYGYGGWIQMVIASEIYVILLTNRVNGRITYNLYMWAERQA